MTDDDAGGTAATDWVRVGRGPRRRTRWDRPAPPKDWRFFVGWFGRVLIVLGLLMFLFVAYQLWGTGIETARAQNRLEDEFAELLEEHAVEPSASSPVPSSEPETSVATPPSTQSVPGSTSAAPGVPAPTGVPPTTVSPTTLPTTVPATTVPPTTVPPTTVPPTTLAEAVPAEAQNLPSFENGDPFAQLVIPKLDLDWLVVSGVTRNDLKQGPGHFRDTPYPGQLGNSAIAGHRTTSGAPFGDLDELAPGDDVEITMPNGYRYVYVVTGSEVVTPDDYRVISESDPTRATLTLVTCTPEWSSTHRLIVYAELDPSRSGPVGEPIIAGPPEPAELDVPPDSTTPAGGSTATPTSEPTAVPGADDADPPPAVPEQSDAFSEGWFADRAAWPQIALWGLALGAIITGGWWLARFWKREWVGALAAIVPFFACLYFFFQNVNRLLPPGL